MATMTDEEYQMYQKYGPNYREYMRFGYGRNQARARNQFNPGGGFYHTDPPQVKKVVENIMGAPAPEQGSPYLSDYLKEYEKTRQRVLQLEDLMNQNQFQYSQPDMSFEDFYNQYYGNYGGDGGGDEGNNGVTEVAAQISQTPQFEGNVPVPNMPGWSVYNGINTMAIVNWVNPKTGERFTVPHGGFIPPSGEGWVKEELKSEPLDPNYKRPDATTMGNGNTGTTKTQPYVILPRAEQTTAAYAQMAKNNAAAAAASANNDRGGDRIVAAAPAPVVAAPTYAGVQSSQALTGQAANNAQMAQSQARESMSDKYITRYDRDEFSPVVAPVKTVVKKSVTPVKVWGNRNN